jgi:NADH:ubiquinone oxidoreductase subunit C
MSPEEAPVVETASTGIAAIDEVLAAAPEASYEDVRGDAVLRVDREHYAGLVEALEDAGFEHFVDLCVVDYLRRPQGRFEVVLNLLSHRHRLRVRVLCAVPGDDPTIPSITGTYPGANFYEREGYDLLGVSFAGHPDLTRILLPDDWVGHPLRKDQPVGAVPVQFKGANQVE